MSLYNHDGTNLSNEQLVEVLPPDQVVTCTRAQ